MGLMIPLDSEVSKEKGFGIDLEIGANAIVRENEGPGCDFSSIGKATNHLSPVRNGFGTLSNDHQVLNSPKNLARVSDNLISSGGRCYFAEEKMRLLETKVGDEMFKEKALRKPSKPPRPPKNAADRKTAKEISELAMLKRSRMEKLKSLRNTKNANAGSNGSNLCALFVTIIFCAIIIWHAISFKGSSVVKANGSAEQSLLHHGEFQKTKKRTKHSFKRSRLRLASQQDYVQDGR